MITGADTVVVTATPAAAAIHRMLRRWQSAWPQLRVDLNGDGFAPWSEDRAGGLSDRGELLVARDERMQADWDEHGYELPGTEEGPFAILYEPCPAARFSVDVTTDPYGRDPGFGFAPYPAQIVGRGLTLVTLVTPATMKDFTRQVVHSLIEVLTQP